MKKVFSFMEVSVLIQATLLVTTSLDLIVHVDSCRQMLPFLHIRLGG